LRILPDFAGFCRVSALSSLLAAGVTGLTNREIAVLIGTTEQVVKNYLRATFDKLGVWSRLELALYVAARWDELDRGTRLRRGRNLRRSSTFALE